MVKADSLMMPKKSLMMIFSNCLVMIFSNSFLCSIIIKLHRGSP